MAVAGVLASARTMLLAAVEADRVCAAVVTAAVVAAAVVAAALLAAPEATHEHVAQPLPSAAQATTAPGLHLHW